MKLSVVIPVYNGADFIEKSYKSILNQQIDDFEILYVNNNSKDDSVKKIHSLVQNDARVYLYHQVKQGAGPTRNLGIEKAKGEYIYLLDIDDDVYPNALKTMMTVLDEYPKVDAVFGKMIKSHSSVSETPLPEVDTLNVIFKERPYWGLKWFSNLKYVVGPPAFLYRSSVFKRIGAYNEALKVGQDTAFDIKLGMLCNIAFLDMYVYLYFKHGASTTDAVKRESSRAFMVWPRLVKEHLPFYLEHDVPVRFRDLLFAQIFQSMGRQLVHTKGFQNRKILKAHLLSEISAIQVPFLIRFYLSILVALPLESIRKIYGYHVVPYVMRQLKKNS